MKTFIRSWKGGAIVALALLVLVGANAPGARLAAGSLFVGNASGVATATAITGTVAISSSGVTSIGTDLDAGDLAAGSVGTSEIGDNVIVSADVDQNLIQVDNSQLSNTNLLALEATPITLLAAPAANFATIVHKVCLVLDAAAGAYTESSDDFVIEYADGLDIVKTDNTDGFDDAAITSRCYVPTQAMVEPTVLSGADTACDTTCGGLKCFTGIASDGNANGGLFVACNGASADSCLCYGYHTPTAASAIRITTVGSGEFGGGNAANTLSVRLWYSIMPTTAFSSGG